VYAAPGFHGSVKGLVATLTDATNIANSATAGMVTNNASGVNLSGTFSGNGSGLTNLTTNGLVKASVKPTTPAP
jgi:hypothetical protein